VGGPADFAAAFDVSHETLARLEVYADTLRLWQRRINLIAPGTLPELWYRHFADSAQLAPLVAELAASGERAGPLRLLDLGSGAGFPGLVLAILLRELGVAVTLIDSDVRKCAFLREAARIAGTSVDIATGRIENSAIRSKLQRFGVITARALAPLDRLLELADAYLAADGCALFLKGRDSEREVAEAARRWQFDVELLPSLTDADARIVRIRHLAKRAEDIP
jgi:16S rRNA (guanine527-N7)-methyltransferase